MATLAALLKHRGFDVGGSDAAVYPPMSDVLAREGIALLDGYSASHIDAAIDLVVVGNAISRGNPELEAVLDRRIRHVSLPEALREHFLWQAKPVVIAGTHGKTTTTALTGWLLAHAGLDPSVFVGGVARNLGADGSSYRIGGPEAPFVIEGDEYDSAFFDKTAKFLKYLPAIAVINNIEFDHADIYPDLDAVRLAFRRFVQLVPRNGLTLLGCDSADAAALAAKAFSRVETFATNVPADWTASEIDVRSGATGFRVHHHGRDEGQCVLPMVGVHNVRNALAALAVGHECGVSFDVLRAGLAAFKGVKRRLEIVGRADDIDIYDDFAHHPTAVAETLAALRAAQPQRRLWAIFEPRSASSCRRLFQDDFARAFAAADHVVIASLFRSTLPVDERLSEDRLVDELRRAGTVAHHLPDIDAILSHLGAEAKPNDVIVVMSNGGFGGIHGKLIATLTARHRSGHADLTP